MNPSQSFGIMVSAVLPRLLVANLLYATENCAPSGNHQGFSIVDRIRGVAFEYGSLQVFRAYSGTESSAKTQNLRSELQSSGVSLIDCPHNGRKEVADKMMIGDILLQIICAIC